MAHALVLDIGGVLACDVWEPLFDGIRARFPTLTKVDLNQVGRTLWDKYAYGSEPDNDGATSQEREYWAKFIDCVRPGLPEGVSAEYFMKMTDEYIRPVHGTMQIIERLQRRSVKLAICSNNTEFCFKRQSDRLNLNAFFDPRNVVLPCRIGKSKSSPRFEMFQAATASLGMSSEECTLVDDRQKNVTLAWKFGMKGIRFIDGADLECRLLGLGFL
ncbi:MAG: hypothetical protein FI707_12700 [SAR202 cluster bacterium]|jgi:HAD superfamily hydrolase (TIGR01509 family)|nr:hypothetical protein [Chloroflexota bacterium]MDP6423022.1 HAD hydrolase-like protein [SAR202 cluster bacterium]MDP6663987.1 HAD hydrolase-like protein [SAR202 cluster bacterium]MDP6798201.1 HAD hydrolase-like protein [SAR202 cluster bacterium]MQG59020.1 hypothetical protein [SAR202 cluster bacterium]|tara:strand:- start:10931 stop:11578 length:648 start_codon:yes stop_codon:yes gene_type:complete